MLEQHGPARRGKAVTAKNHNRQAAQECESGHAAAAQ